MSDNKFGYNNPRDNLGSRPNNTFVSDRKKISITKIYSLLKEMSNKTEQTNYNLNFLKVSLTECFLKAILQTLLNF